MRLLKLVPDNTNIDFMRWRNSAVPVDPAGGREHAAGRVRGLNFGVDFVGGQMIRRQLRTADRRRAAAQRVGRLELASEHPGVRRAAKLPDPPASPRGRRGGFEPRRKPGPGMLEQQYPGDDRRGRDGVGQGQRGAGLGRGAGDHPGDDRDRDLHLVPLRMAVRRRRARHPVPRRRVTLGFFRADPAPGRPQRRRRGPDDRRLFAQRHRRHLRPNPRESAQVPQDGDRPAAQPLAQRDPGADGRHVADDAAGARRSLLLIGPDVIFGLTIAIFLGIFIGTYSSIYISAPILVWLGVTPDSFVRARLPTRRPRDGLTRSAKVPLIAHPHACLPHRPTLMRISCRT
jgi:preprotein translocase subunit SecF